MSKTLRTRSDRAVVLAAMMAAPVSASLHAADQPAGKADDSSVMMFKQYDTDGDGRVSATEFQKHGGDASLFKAMDADGSGTLSQRELSDGPRADAGTKGGNVVADAWVTAKVKTMLLADDVVKGLDIDVDTENGVVHLKGKVENSAQSQRAERIAEGIKGVKRVVNQLTVAAS